MGNFAIVFGKSGSGKSRSLCNFGEEELFLNQVVKKPLPFRKKFKYTMVSDDVDKIIRALQKMPTKVAVIDDATYLMTDAFMKGHSAPKKGASQFDLYNDIADSFWRLILAIQALPDDVNVFVIMHEEQNDYGETKLRTIGKLLDQKVCIEGMSTIVLHCLPKGSRHYFRTNTDGSDISKSPEGMFPLEMENDLKEADTKIREYYAGENVNEQEGTEGVSDLEGNEG